MKKKILVTMICLSTVLMLAACGKKEEITDTETTTTEVAEDTVTDTEGNLTIEEPKEEINEIEVFTEDSATNDTRIKSFDEFSDEEFSEFVSDGQELISSRKSCTEISLVKGILLGRDNDDNLTNDLFLFYEYKSEDGSIGYAAVDFVRAFSTDENDVDVHFSMGNNPMFSKTLESVVENKTSTYNIVIFEEKDF